jgi:putative thiamine transport system ATP-binding protein
MSLSVLVRRLGTPAQVLIENLSLSVAPGVIHTVMGASGCGKSSLLAAVCGTLAEGMHFEGDVALNGQNLTHRPTERRQIGILFQEDLLFAHMTVFENLLFAVPAGPRKQREAQVNQGLADLEMSRFAHADPATLSGGQRGRVALMRALLAQPKALLLDEPFAKLDADLRERMRQFVFGQVAQRQLPVLLVTHDASDIADLAHVTRLQPHV